MSRSGPVYETSPEHVPDWRDQAACIGADVELFFPIGQSPRALLDEQEALFICFRCPVKAKCRQFALDGREPHGIFGGMTEMERSRELRRQGRARSAGQKIGRDT